MARHKTITHLPLPPPAPAAAPPLVMQIMTALPQLVMVAIFTVDLVTATGWPAMTPTAGSHGSRRHGRR